MSSLAKNNNTLMAMVLVQLCQNVLLEDRWQDKLENFLPSISTIDLAVQDTFFFNLMIPMRQLNPSQLGKLPFLLWSRMNLPSPVHQNISQKGISLL